jgi:hypothetical protein
MGADDGHEINTILAHYRFSLDRPSAARDNSPGQGKAERRSATYCLPRCPRSIVAALACTTLSILREPCMARPVSGWAEF